MKKILFRITREDTFAAEISMTALRVFAGLTMAIAHGSGKVPPSEKFVEGVASMGFPLPVFFAWAAAGAEFLGGLFLAFGLLTRPAAAFIAFTMGIAAFRVHTADPFHVKELSLLYFTISLVFLCRGAGNFSLDRIFFKQK